MSSDTHNTHNPQEFIQPSPEIEMYELKTILPAGMVLEVNRNPSLRILSKVAIGEEPPRIVAQCILTTYELKLFEVILAHFPDYTPIEYLMAAMDGNAVEVSREVYYQALANHAVEDIIRPTRNIVSRLRQKLHLLGVGVRPILETGYVLFPRSLPRMSARQGQRAKSHTVSAAEASKEAV